MIRWVDNLSELYSFIGYVVVGAPDRFPTEDYLPADEQMTLDRAFSELREGMRFVPRAHEPGFHETLSAHLDAALESYRAGDIKAGAHRLQELRRLIFSK